MVIKVEIFPRENREMGRAAFFCFESTTLLFMIENQQEPFTKRWPYVR
jgi:hypothetical protein